MKINFYNYDLIGKKMRHDMIRRNNYFRKYPTNSYEMFLKKYRFYSTYSPTSGNFSLNTKTISLLNFTKEQLKDILRFEPDSRMIYIDYKDYKKVLQQFNKIEFPNQDINKIKTFLLASLKEKTDYIVILPQCMEP